MVIFDGFMVIDKVDVFNVLDVWIGIFCGVKYLIEVDVVMVNILNVYFVKSKLWEN